MAELISDRLWKEIKPLLPERKVSPRGGRPAVDDRKALTGIVFVLKTGMPWQALPAEMGCGSGVTCWRRLREWTKAGVWSVIHAKLLHLLGRKGKLRASRAVVDTASVRAVFGGRIPDRTPRTAGKVAVNAIC
jgi:transposase